MDPTFRFNIPCSPQQRSVYIPMALPHERPHSLLADFAPRTKQSSMLYSILPSAVQSRLPRLPSLRRSVSMYGLATRRKVDSSRPGSGSRTPEMTMVLSGARVTEELGYEIESLSSDDDLANTGSTGKGRQTMELTESKSGIAWKFANQGKDTPSFSKCHSTNGSLFYRPQPTLTSRRRVIYDIPRPSIRKPKFCKTTLSPRPHLPPTSSPLRPHNRRTIERAERTTSRSRGAPPTRGEQRLQFSKSLRQFRRPAIPPPSDACFNHRPDVHSLPIHPTLPQISSQRRISIRTGA